MLRRLVAFANRLAHRRTVVVWLFALCILFFYIRFDDASVQQRLPTFAKKQDHDKGETCNIPELKMYTPELNAFLKKPATYAAGTRMAFAGLNNEKQRADVIAYLRSLSAAPIPLP